MEDEGIYVQYEWGYDMCGVGEREERNIKENNYAVLYCNTTTFTFHEKFYYALML